MQSPVILQLTNSTITAVTTKEMTKIKHTYRTLPEEPENEVLRTKSGISAG